MGIRSTVGFDVVNESVRNFLGEWYGEQCVHLAGHLSYTSATIHKVRRTKYQVAAGRVEWRGTSGPDRARPATAWQITYMCVCVFLFMFWYMLVYFKYLHIC